MQDSYFLRKILFAGIFFVIVYGISPCTVQAQVCDNNFGDPVVDITFGSGNGGGGYAPSASYTYTTSTCPNDGYYTITTQTSQCFGDTWHTILSDHTGSGAFMLVNASYDPGDFFVSTVKDLCPNNTYEFSAWVMNVVKSRAVPILPNLVFRIETPAGVVLSSYSTGDIPVTDAPQWIKYGFVFTTPVNSRDVVLRITNNAPGGNGNDLALDDITFRPCQKKIPSAIIGIDEDVIDLCAGNAGSYTFEVDQPAGFVTPLYQWQASNDSGKLWQDIPGAESLMYQTPDLQNVGSYWYRLTAVEASVADLNSCKITSEVSEINIHPNPVANAGPDKVTLANNPVTLSGSSKGDETTYVWWPDLYISDPLQLNPVVSPPTDFTYKFLVKSKWGCSDSDEVNVKVYREIFVPNAFTPNGDGINDQWRIPSLDTSFGGSVSLFNRWGQAIYRNSSSIVSWDGTANGEPQPAGVYYYFINVSKFNLKLRGTVNLIR